jgi:hypothetical protein
LRLQNMRGGKVKLQSIVMPDMELTGTPQGDALYSMELALSLERLNNEKLLALHKVRPASQADLTLKYPQAPGLLCELTLEIRFKMHGLATVCSY